MVDRLRGTGEYFPRFLEAHGLTPHDGYRRLVFYPDDQTKLLVPDQTIVLRNLAEYDFYDTTGRLIENVKGGQGDLVEVLAVKKDCPDLLIGAVIKRAELPDPDATHIAELSGSPQTKVLVLNAEIDVARRIARANFEHILHANVDLGDVITYRITPKEFMEEAERLIRRGFRLPAYIVAYGELAKLQEEIQRYLQEAKFANNS